MYMMQANLQKEYLREKRNTCESTKYKKNESAK